MNEGRELAEEHWIWVESILHKIYVDAFEHGYKHGKSCDSKLQGES
jgi:hypothetical protein